VVGLFLFMKLSICTICGTPYDETGYDKCPDCQYDHRFIKLRKSYEEANNEKRQDGEGEQGNA
jgi:DNA-directed RNA polymerase subunit RPC12/RpoP